jgi:glycosyltransferase involved in cell wall biosynthesis
MNEEEGIADCFRAVRRVFERDLPGCDYEHIFCDNASTDSTAAILKKLVEEDPKVRLIINARNFGTLRSNFNGLLSARGDAVLVALAADLQDPPELIPQFVARWREGFEVVYGIRRKREEGWAMRTARRAYYRLVSGAARFPIPVDVGEFQLVDRKVVEALRRIDDHDPYVRGLIAFCGFHSTGIPFTWKKRRKGRSKARLLAVIDLGLNGLISVSGAPMRLCLVTGLAVTALSLLGAAVGIASDLAADGRVSPPGFPALIAAVALFAGVQLTFTGVLGEYVAAIHNQVRKRPLVVERERVNFDEPAERLNGMARGLSIVSRRCDTTARRLVPGRPRGVSKPGRRAGIRSVAGPGAPSVGVSRDRERPP